MRLQVNQQIDLGTVQFGTTKEFEVSVKNTTPNRLNIQVTPRCGSCTKLVSSPAYIESNGEVVVKLAFTPTKKGEQSKLFDIRVDGVIESTITFKASVV